MKNLLSLTEKKFRQINYLHSNFFRKTITFTKFLPKKSVRQCGYYGILLPSLCRKISVKATFLLKNFTVN